MPRRALLIFHNPIKLNQAFQIYLEQITPLLLIVWELDIVWGLASSQWPPSSSGNLQLALFIYISWLTPATTPSQLIKGICIWPFLPFPPPLPNLLFQWTEIPNLQDSCLIHVLVSTLLALLLTRDLQPSSLLYLLLFLFAGFSLSG